MLFRSEFAVNRENKEWKFYVLQIKPLIKNEYHMDIDKENIDMSKAILRADKGMGNGKITDIQDLIYVDPRHFDRLRTEQGNFSESLCSRIPVANTAILCTNPHHSVFPSANSLMRRPLTVPGAPGR